jgi:hypothetical protein
LLLLSGSTVLLLSRRATLESCLSLLEDLVKADGLVASVLAVVLAVVLSVVNIAGVLGSLAFAGGVNEGSVQSSSGTLSFSFAVVLGLTSLALLSLSVAFAFASCGSTIRSSSKSDVGGGGACSI